MRKVFKKTLSNKQKGVSCFLKDAIGVSECSFFSRFPYFEKWFFFFTPLSQQSAAMMDHESKLGASLGM